jgi:transcriptional regulator of acetoin/glycerol metabolism
MIPTRESVLPLDELTDAYMKHVVAVCDGNISQASKRLGVARQTLYRRLPELKDVG